MEVRAELLRRVGPAHRERAARLGVDDLSAELEVPEHIERAPGMVVVEAHEADERRLVALTGAHVLDQPLPMPSAHDLAGLRQPLAVMLRRRRCRSLRIEPGGEEHSLDQIPAGGAPIRHAVGPADGLELLPPQLAQDKRCTPVELGPEELSELALAGGASGTQPDAE